MDKPRYIIVHCVLNKPGNPVKETYMRTDLIEVFSVSEDAMTQIGAASSIQFPAGIMFVTETVEEIAALIEKAEKG